MSGQRLTYRMGQVAGDTRSEIHPREIGKLFQLVTRSEQVEPCCQLSGRYEAVELDQHRPVYRLAEPVEHCWR